MPQRIDDSTVADDAQLWRRIAVPTWVTKEEDGSIRVSSVAFIDRRSGEVSVFLAESTTTEQLMGGRNSSTAAIASIEASVPRKIGHIVAATPESPEAGPGHRVIVPTPAESGSSKIKRAAKVMAAAATWVLPPNEDVL